MDLIHRPLHGDPDDERLLATTVETADGFIARARGLTFRRSFPEGHALAFRFRTCRPRALHMLFVPFDIDALWLVEGEVSEVARLHAWTGFGRARADTVIELPAGGADDVAIGDTVELRGSEP